MSNQPTGSGTPLAQAEAFNLILAVLIVPANHSLEGNIRRSHVFSAMTKAKPGKLEVSSNLQPMSLKLQN